MSKLIKWTFVFSMTILLHTSNCKRYKRGITDFLIPGINIGDIALDQIKLLIWGKPVDKDQMIIDRQLDHMKTTDEILRLSQQIALSVDRAPELTLLIQSLQKMPEHLNKIDSAFKQYEFYERKNKSNYRVLEFAKNSINRYSGPLNEVLELYSIVVPSSANQRALKSEDYSLLSLVSRNIKGFEKLCDDFKSEQSMLYSIMDTLMVSELKTLLIMEFSIRKLSQIEDVEYSDEMELLRDGLKERFMKLSTQFQSHMRGAPRDVWRCDPKVHQMGKTFFKMFNFQLYVVRERELTGPHNCELTCGNYNAVKHEICTDYSDSIGYVGSLAVPISYRRYKNACQEVRICTGKLYQCTTYFGKTKEVWTCPEPKKRIRRYQYISEGDPDKSGHTIYGLPPNSPHPTCNTSYTFDVSYYHSPNYCEVCLCTCDDSHAVYGDKRINIRPVTADKDHVVTGIRWLKDSHMLHLQIQQGKLLSRGKVDVSSLNWKPIQKPRHKDEFTTITYADLRGFMLHDLELKDLKGSVVAGVQLATSRIKTRRFICLRLLPVRYDYQAGKLIYTKPFYENPDNSIAEGLWDPSYVATTNNEYAFPGKNSPLRAPKTSEPVDPKYTHVFLTTSDFLDDAGSNTVPYFDMQDNVLNPPVPLSGIGVYLKTTEKTAGFLGLKLITFDFTPHIVEEIHNTTTH